MHFQDIISFNEKYFDGSTVALPLIVFHDLQVIFCKGGRMNEH